MRIAKIIITVFLLSASIFLYRNWGEIKEVSAKTMEELQKEIEQYQKELDRLSVQSKTLQNQIYQFDTQIKLTSLKINQTEEKINLLAGRIDLLEGSLDSLSDAFSSRANETYRMARFGDPLMMVLSSPDLSQAVSRFHYLRKIQEADRELLQRLQTAQNNYREEKSDQEDLHDELEQQKKNLDAQKLAKAALLNQTKNDEVKYQQLLAQALAEKAAIEKALASGVKVGPVSAGSPIGLVGNSGYPGCSTGKHLHFEIRKNNTWVDPLPYMQGKSVSNEQDDSGNMVSAGSGGWSWPIKDTIRMTQWYGKTPFSWRYSYSGGIHTGLDMVSTSSDIITAPADGTLYKSSQSCGSSSIINIVYIEHADGVYSFYLHVQ